MLKLIDASGTIHYHLKEDLIHAELHPEEKRKTLDREGNVVVEYYGYVQFGKTPIFLNLSKEGAELVEEQIGEV